MATQRPNWHTDDDDSTWQRVKSAFKNDWEQTKHDFGADGARDLDQDVDDTVKQAAGNEDAFENREQALRFGYTARRQFGDRHPDWNDDLEAQLRSDYAGDFARDSDDIRYGYNYQVDRRS